VQISSGADARISYEHCWSNSLNGGKVLLKFLKKTSLSKDALSVFDEVSAAPFFKVGTWLEVFIKYLTAFQNCLLPKFDILSK